MACDMSPPGSLRSSRERGQENVLVMTDIVFLLQAQTAFLQGERKGQENVLVMTDIVFLLQAQTAFLQGERKGQENLKKDLVRRIKMLEYVLKQERAKYHKLKYGTELNQGDMKPPSYESTKYLFSPDEVNENEAPGSLNNQLSWKQGRQLLQTVSSGGGLHRHHPGCEGSEGANPAGYGWSRRGRPGERTGPETPLVNGTDTVPKGTDTGGGKTEVSESSVVPDTFRFYCDEDDDEDGAGLDRTVMEQTGPTGTMVRKKPPSSSSPTLNMDTSEDPDAEDALKGFDFLSSPDNMDTSPESRSWGRDGLGEGGAVCYVRGVGRGPGFDNQTQGGVQEGAQGEEGGKET
ncbi:striatin-like [Oncorhynchus keta]|uniref:striatin-like n=1 Tax=Oncorhynchus keta TaxID=8018 RepID=UPI00227A8A00|nr:striatin-like [Oncorhynchus keta]